MRRVKSGEADAHPEDDDGHGDENHALAGASVGQRFVFRRGDFAEEDALIGPQQIDRGENDAASRPRTPTPRDVRNVPTRIRNSPTKPLSIGKPADERRRQTGRTPRRHRHGRGQAAEFLISCVWRRS